MDKGIKTSSKPADVFKTFPEFTKLTIDDRIKYDTLVQSYPPISGISFANLMNWWNSLDSCAISTLNGNLIISYYLPGSEKLSGLSVVGTQKLNETISHIFDYQQSIGERARLVHVPEFVIGHIKYPELFRYKSEPATDEYVVAIAKYYPLSQNVGFRKARIRKFLARHSKESLAVKSLDLGMHENRQLLLETARAWDSQAAVWNVVKHMDDGMDVAIDKSEQLATINLCLFIKGELQAFILFYETPDPRYNTLSHAIINDDIPYTFDYAVYAFSEWFADRGITYINLDSDLGIPMLRVLKLALGPDHYFKFNSIEPA